jgi:hypothetical protein
MMLVEKPEEKKTLGRPRSRLEDKIKVDLERICGKDVEWLHLAQNRDGWRPLLSAVMNLRVP